MAVDVLYVQSVPIRCKGFGFFCSARIFLIFVNVMVSPSPLTDVSGKVKEYNIPECNTPSLL